MTVVDQTRSRLVIEVRSNLGIVAILCDIRRHLWNSARMMHRVVSAAALVRYRLRISSAQGRDCGNSLSQRVLVTSFSLIVAERNWS